MEARPTNEASSGIWLGLTAYGIWGFLPLYWPLLRPAGAVEILAHRIVWSLLFVLLLLLRGQRFSAIRGIGRRQLRLLAVASAFVGLNWGLYIWAVNHHHVVETSLGYFINPLISIVLGVIVLGESLRRTQWFAVSLVIIAILVLSVGAGRLPWIALALACSFALYGLLKKKAGAPAAVGLAIETSLLFLPAVGYLMFLETSGTGMFVHAGARKTSLLMASGVVTAIPLLCFAGAANRIPLVVLGLLQYIAPLIQFACGVLVFREAMPLSRWIGFFLAWAAVALLAADGLSHRASKQPSAASKM